MVWNIVLLGAPAVGKGAQAASLSARLGVPHVSTGDLLRAEIASGSPVGRRLKATVESGGLVDDESILALVSARLEDEACRRGVVLDGFPRTLQQARGLDELLVCRGSRVEHAIHLHAPEDTLLERLSGRLACAGCGATFHVRLRPPVRPGICDRCSGPVRRRADDEEAVIRARLRAHAERIQPLLEHYRHAGVLAEVDGSEAIGKVAATIQRTIAAPGLVSR